MTGSTRHFSFFVFIIILRPSIHIIPETFIVDEHHIHIYASKDNDGTIVKAKRPADLFRNNIATPALVASIINGKYVNAMSLEKLIIHENS